MENSKDNSADFNAGLYRQRWLVLFYKDIALFNPEDPKGPDLINKNTGQLIELKSDSYSSGNFFIEEKSVINSTGRQIEGGLWKAQRDGCDLFAYEFISVENKYPYLFWFKTKTFLDHVEKNKDKYKRTSCNKRGVTSYGYLVPIKDVEHLAFQKDDNLDFQIMSWFENLDVKSQFQLAMLVILTKGTEELTIFLEKLIEKEIATSCEAEQYSKIAK